MPNTLLRTEFAEFLRRVDILAAASIAAPRAWLELRDRFERYRQMPATGAVRLADALIRPGKGDDLGWLLAHAVAEQTGIDMPGIQAKVDQHVYGVIEAKLRALWATHAKTAYQAAANAFTDAAHAFTAAAHATNVDTTDAAVVAHMSTEQTAAWAAAPTLAAQLDAALPVLVTAAQLAGKTVDDETGGTLALCVDTTNADKRALWAAWETETGRCGRWAALTARGEGSPPATIRALEDLDTFAPYPRPRPLEVRREPEPGAPPGFYRDVVHDPEAPGYQPPDEPQRTMIPGKRLTRGAVIR